MELEHKNVILIMPFYFGYERPIKNQLEKKGANVYLINENIENTNGLYRIANIYFDKLRNNIELNYYKKAFKQIKFKPDILFVIKGESLRDDALKYILNYCEGCKKIIYQWDSVNNYEYSVGLSKYFDYCFTFDRADSDKYKWYYRPLYFDPNVCHPHKKKDYDLCFIGSLHTQRKKIYYYAKKIAQVYKLNTFLYLFSDKWSYLRQRYLKRNPTFEMDYRDLQFTPLPQENTNKIYDSSLAIIDYKFPGQTGLTMRSIESVGHGCKLITNNASVRDEPFYDERNVFIYDIDNFNIPKDFFTNSYIKPMDDVYKHYSVEGWVNEIFSKI